jgi:hypothetical protein
MKKQHITLATLFVGLLIIRLVLVFSVDHFDPDAYFHIRQIEHIKDSMLPLFYDSLSAGGREVVFLPLFHYVLALFSFFFPIAWVVRVLPQFFISLLPVIVYFIVYGMTNKHTPSLFSALLSATVPFLFSATLFTLSPLTLTIPLLFFMLYIFLHLEKKRSDVYFILILTALSLVHPSALLLIVGLLGYLLVSRIEKLRIQRSELELIFFSTFLFLWIQFLFYKDVFLLHGVPLFQQTSSGIVITDFFQIGMLPLVLGIYCMYKYLFNVKNKYIYLYVSIAIGAALLTFFEVFHPLTGFIYLSICLSILSGPGYVLFTRYMRKTRIAHYETVIIVLLFVLIIPSMVIPSWVAIDTAREKTVSAELFDALRWIEEMTAEDSVVVGGVGEGYLISTVARRQNIIDYSFLLVKDVDARREAVQRIYETTFLTEAVKLFTLYGVDYVLLSQEAQQNYGITSLRYKDECLREVYNKGVVIIHTRCRLQVS